MQKGKKVRHLETSVTINPNRMLLSVCSLTTDEIISEGAFLTLNLDKGPSIYIMSAKEWVGLENCQFCWNSVLYLSWFHNCFKRVGGSEKVQNYADLTYGWSPSKLYIDAHITLPFKMFDMGQKLSHLAW